ncbi:MAG TPA: shikimate dehydrogenase [Thermomicrobiales bacterium]|nr:shikimate dehydrogenase [Thermomicrobiales bacterium]
MSEHRRVGLIGDPVEHSLSPAFQQPAFDALGLDIRYELWPTPLALLPDRLADLRAGRAIGANVTVPYKEAAFAAVDEASDLARRAGAVNTIVPRDGRLYGDNTDIHGFIVPLAERGVRFSEMEAMVLGAGGAARGIVVALLDAGVRRVHVLNRTVERADRLAVALADDRVVSAATTLATLLAPAATLLVNATSLGWQGQELPLDPSVFAGLPRHAIAYDLTYRETPFLRAARDARLATIDGLPMLVHQGARSFELWTGHDAPTDVMWSAAVAARAARGG